MKSNKFGFFQSYDEMQKTFERLNLTNAAKDHLKTNKYEYKLPKIKNTALIASQDNHESTQNMDSTDALIYNIPEIILRRRWKTYQPPVDHQPHCTTFKASYGTYMREIKLSAQIARVSGRYPNRSVPKPPKFKIVLPSELNKG
jgi:hypothetical protein